ncbi:L-aspartate oxidase [Diaphorobacter sp. HDW4B]|uniref:L-aspartate oxidase n=1 Tax=Diaphorobacter sp. HDW4B TaxID=2714925 RepID=UPI00140A713D|nr:L-aspartate oxidase [Diaphorobacter sp. HDW4B]QIL68979.1 L-aspartate oxidase [Diaphorobacter sp. HDW4B]
MTASRTTDVLIIGAGLAGMATSLSLPQHLQIDMLSKGRIDECASAWAQGGIAAVLDPQDSVDAHVNDTLIAGAGINKLLAVRQILSQAPAAIAWLIEQGVEFDRMEDGQTLHLTREGGHSHRRIAHVKDRTGLAVQQALLRACRARANIRIHESHAAIDLPHAHASSANTCFGAWVREPDGKVTPWLAGHTVLATGGLGQLFSRSTNPWTATGDGIAMAARAGCAVQDMEFVQFHPTALQVNGRAAGLVTEALRGEGALLKLPNGERFMPRHDERAELAPRDIVSRAIHTEMQRGNLAFVHLDISHQPREWLAQHFPGVMQLCASHGIDIASQPIPVAPCAHYACGGVRAEVNGTTDLSNLHAVGEVACTGLHGANRLASNSLLECVVMGRAAAQAIAASKPAKATPQSALLMGSAGQSTVSGVEQISPIAQVLAQLMDECVGIQRNQQGLAQTARQISAWQHMLGAADPALRNRLEASSQIVNAALQRTHSCGAHARTDDISSEINNPETEMM